MFTLGSETSFSAGLVSNLKKKKSQKSFWCNSLPQDNCGEDGRVYSEGGRAPLSAQGQKFAKNFRNLILKEIRNSEGINGGDMASQPLSVWTSTNERSKNIGSFFEKDAQVVEITALADMNPGIVDGLSKTQIRVFPFLLFRPWLDSKPHIITFRKISPMNMLNIRKTFTVTDFHGLRYFTLNSSRSSIEAMINPTFNTHSPIETLLLD